MSHNYFPDRSGEFFPLDVSVERERVATTPAGSSFGASIDAEEQGGYIWLPPAGKSVVTRSWVAPGVHAINNRDKGFYGVSLGPPDSYRSSQHFLYRYALMCLAWSSVSHAIQCRPCIARINPANLSTADPQNVAHNATHKIRVWDYLPFDACVYNASMIQVSARGGVIDIGSLSSANEEDYILLGFEVCNSHTSSASLNYAAFMCSLWRCDEPLSFFEPEGR